MKKGFLTILFLGLLGVSFNAAFAQAAVNKSQNPSVEVNFFYSKTCPHCAAERKFLNDLEEKYPEITINRHSVSEPESIELMQEFVSKYNAERYLGLVPLTFVGGNVFPGFDNAQGIGKDIENAIKHRLDTEDGQQKKDNIVNLPLLGKLDTTKYSLPALTVIMGILDGFNICSLGALVLILGLVLKLRSRAKIFTFGGTFVATTAVIYGLLIVLWYKLFSLLSGYLRIMEILIGILGIGGGLYFLKEFIRFRKYGPTCEEDIGEKVSLKFTERIKKALSEESNVGIIGLAGIIFLFAAAITIVEFPCSAAVPVVFAGILANAQLSAFWYLLYIAIFVLFYMLDELLVFSVAVWKMSVWLASPKFVTWVTFTEAVILLALGLFYLIGF